MHVSAAMNRNRPDTKTLPLFASNVQFVIYDCGSPLVGAVDNTGDDIEELSNPFVAPLPPAFHQSRLLIDQKNSTIKNDCLWRVLARILTGSKDCRCLKAKAL